MTIFSLAGPAFAENKNPKVAVVGAGLAGLTAAYRLQQKGMDVHVYEARNRVGGRVLTVKIGDQVAELGGHSIADGGEAENIHRLIEEFGLELIGGKVKLNHSYFTGVELIPIQQILRDRHFEQELLRAQLNDLAQKCKNMREVLDEIFEEDDPLYNSLVVRLSGYEGAPPEKLSSLYVETLYHMLIGGVAAVHTVHGEEEPQITVMSIKGGNALLPEMLAQTLGDKLHLNCPLKSVSKNSDNSFLLTFQNGQQTIADILVLAIPCSIYGEVLFDENVIPLQRLEDIKNVRYGTNAKILVPFPASPAKKMGFLNDRVGCYLDANSNILIMHCTGAASQFSAETISDRYSQERLLMETGFQDLCPPFLAPVFAKDQSFASYEGPVGYSWPNDPYVKGSYSYIAPGQEVLMTAIKEEQGEAVKTLFAPIDRTIYFAGEHASILMDAPGTMEAACESGERAARMIINGNAR